MSESLIPTQSLSSVQGVSDVSVKFANLEDTIAALRKMAGTAQQAPVQAPAVDFAQLMDGALKNISANQASARAQQQQYSLGDDSISLHQVMVDLQKASLSFQQLVQVRNKLVSAYQEIMGMPV